MRRCVLDAQDGLSSARPKEILGRQVARWGRLAWREVCDGKADPPDRVEAR